jgi:hypothetical protein
MRTGQLNRINLDWYPFFEIGLLFQPQAAFLRHPHRGQVPGLDYRYHAPETQHLKTIIPHRCNGFGCQALVPIVGLQAVADFDLERSINTSAAGCVAYQWSFRFASDDS